jgi:eukaryotic-like serine/threonine-protein kinase
VVFRGKKLSDTKPARPRRAKREQPPRTRYRLSLFVGLSGVSAGVASAVVLALLMRPSVPTPDPTPWRATPEEVAPFAADGGVAEEALASAQGESRGTFPPILHLGRAMPKSAYPGQKKPPCDPNAELDALGACWIIMAMLPPCGSSGFEYNGRCVFPNMLLPRQPISEQP